MLHFNMSLPKTTWRQLFGGLTLGHWWPKTMGCIECLLNRRQSTAKHNKWDGVAHLTSKLDLKYPIDHAPRDVGRGTNTWRVVRCYIVFASDNVTAPSGTTWRSFIENDTWKKTKVKQEVQKCLLNQEFRNQITSNDYSHVPQNVIDALVIKTRTSQPEPVIQWVCLSQMRHFIQAQSASFARWIATSSTTLKTAAGEILVVPTSSRIWARSELLSKARTPASYNIVTIVTHTHNSRTYSSE